MSTTVIKHFDTNGEGGIIRLEVPEGPNNAVSVGHAGWLHVRLETEPGTLMRLDLPPLMVLSVSSTEPIDDGPF